MCVITLNVWKKNGIKSLDFGNLIKICFFFSRRKMCRNRTSCRSHRIYGFAFLKCLFFMVLYEKYCEIIDQYSPPVRRARLHCAPIMSQLHIRQLTFAASDRTHNTNQQLERFFSVKINKITFRFNSADKIRARFCLLFFFHHSRPATINS